MTEMQNNSATKFQDSRSALPKGDYVLLPLISLATILLMFVCSEVLTRIVWAEKTANACMIHDKVGGDRFRPNCTVQLKNAEGPWAPYHFNECGYRSKTSCGTKPPETLRIAVVGSSVSEGLFVPYEQTWFARARSELNRACSRPVDVQNMGIQGSSPVYVYRRLKEALALKPDVIIYSLGPFDLEQQIDPVELAERNQPSRTLPREAVHWNPEPLKRLQLFLVGSRTVLVAQHFLFANRDLYLRTYMLYGDKVDFLRRPLTSAWQKRFADFDLIVGDMADKLKTAGIPLILVPSPSRAEAAMLSSPSQLPSNIDPAAFGRQIESIASKHGVEYVNLMDAFSRIPNSQNLFYVVDSHATSDGQQVIAQSLVEKLEDGTVPAFSGCTLQQTAKREAIAHPPSLRSFMTESNLNSNPDY